MVKAKGGPGGAEASPQLSHRRGFSRGESFSLPRPLPHVGRGLLPARVGPRAKCAEGPFPRAEGPRAQPDPPPRGALQLPLAQSHAPQGRQVLADRLHWGP